MQYAEKNKPTTISFVLQTTSGDLAQNVALNTITLYWFKPGANSLTTLSPQPGIDLFNRSGGIYEYLLPETETDQAGLGALIIEAPQVSQTLIPVLVEDDEQYADGCLPSFRDLVIPMQLKPGVWEATGDDSKAALNVRYGFENEQTTNKQFSVTSGDLYNLGRGIYGILLDDSALKDGELTAVINETGYYPQKITLKFAIKEKYEFKIQAVDSTNQPIAGLKIRIYTQADLGFVGEYITGADGYIKPYLPLGNYIAVKISGDKVFNENNIGFEVTPEDGLNCLTVYTSGYVYDPVLPQQPTTVKGKAFLLLPNNTPYVGRKIRTKTHVPTLSGDYLVMGEIEQETDEYGKAEFDLIPGTKITVFVEGTYINRMIEVPSTDFNLLTEALAADDPFTIQTPSFPIAPIHVP